MYARGSLALALFVQLAFGASASVAQSVSTAPAAKSFKVGTMQVSVLHDGRLAIPNDGSVFGANASPVEVAELLRRAGRPTDKIYLDIDVLLVRTKGHLALIDTGYGPEGKSVLKDSLALVQVSPEDITDVFITHAHEDHVGGLVDANGNPAFRNATIHMSSKDGISCRPARKRATLPGQCARKSGRSFRARRSFPVFVRRRFTAIRPVT